MSQRPRVLAPICSYFVLISSLYFYFVVKCMCQTKLIAPSALSVSKTFGQSGRTSQAWNRPVNSPMSSLPVCDEQLILHGCCRELTITRRSVRLESSKTTRSLHRSATITQLRCPPSADDTCTNFITKGWGSTRRTTMTHFNPWGTVITDEVKALQ